MTVSMNWKLCEIGFSTKSHASVQCSYWIMITFDVKIIRVSLLFNGIVETQEPETLHVSTFRGYYGLINSLGRNRIRSMWHAWKRDILTIIVCLIKYTWLRCALFCLYPGDLKILVFPGSQIQLKHWGRDKNDDTIFSKAHSWTEMYEFRLIFHWRLLHFTISQHWFIMAWCRWCD